MRQTQCTSGCLKNNEITMDNKPVSGCPETFKHKLTCQENPERETLPGISL